jgi:HEAT repeat protein
MAAFGASSWATRPDAGPAAALADADASVAAAGTRALGSLGRGDAEDAIIAAIPAAKSPEPRASMLLSLWRYADPASAAAAAKFATDPDGQVRSAALYTLSRKPIDSSLAALTAALADPDADAAATAARGIGVLGKKESIGPLAAALDGGRTPLQTNALVALEAILEKNPGAVVAEDRKARILALAGDANPNLALPALVLLRQFRRPTATCGSGSGRSPDRRRAPASGRRRFGRRRVPGQGEAVLDAAAAADAPLRATAAETSAS